MLRTCPRASRLHTALKVHRMSSSARSTPSSVRATYPSPLGDLALCFEGGSLTRIQNGSLPESVTRKTTHVPLSDPVVGPVAAQLDEYFSGKRKDFDLDIKLHGTEFQERVWRELLKIPYGKTVSYSELARSAGAPNSWRAAANAVGRNAHLICVPCHRVIASDGTLGGFSAGLDAKRHLHDVEGIDVKKALAKTKKARVTSKPAS